MPGASKRIEFRLTHRLIPVLLSLFFLTSCDEGRAPDEPALASLTGRAVLPADTFAHGPAVGQALESRINGRDLPFDSVPVQGFS
jgi:hypothetical protein